MVSGIEPAPGWWQASNGQWYPSEERPGPPSMTMEPDGSITTVAVNTGPQSSYQMATVPGATSTVANLLWLIVGVPMAFSYLVAGVLNCLTVIGIPFGIQAFKLAGFALWPFGRAVATRPGQDVGLSTLGNVIWFIFSGLWLAIGHVIFGLLACLTVIGIPFGVASFKMAGLALAPFGKMIVRRDQVPAGVTVAFTFQG